VSAAAEAFFAWGAPLIVDPGVMLTNAAAATTENCQVVFIILLCHRESGPSK
jgi:hypothetical protein